MNRDELLAFCQEDPRIEVEDQLASGEVPLSFLVMHPQFNFHPRSQYMVDCLVLEDRVDFIVACADWENGKRNKDNYPAELALCFKYELTFEACADYIKQLPKPLDAFGPVTEVY